MSRQLALALWLIVAWAIACPLVGSVSAAPLSAPAVSRAPSPKLAALRHDRQPVRFRIDQGQNVNEFLQSKELTVHALLRTGSSPRIVVATPAGNSGIGLWFKSPATSSGGLRLESGLEPVEQAGEKGVSFRVSGPGRLELKRLVLDSVRSLRAEANGEYDNRRKVLESALKTLDSPAGRQAGATPELLAEIKDWIEPRRVVDAQRPSAVIFERQAVGTSARYRLELIPRPGTRIEGDGTNLSVRGNGRTEFEVRAFLDRPTPKPLARVLRERGGVQERNLRFLVNEQGWMAGSWQYLTYFGRDTLISAALLGDRATPHAVGVALGSVLDRVNGRGQVSHEEANGEQAALERLQKLSSRVAEGKARLTPRAISGLERPIQDYKMIDGEYLLPQLLDPYLRQASPAELRRTLTPARIQALARVFSRILEQTDGGLVHLKRGQIVGNWRDSADGLGGGRTPLDVNAYLVPSALRSLANLLERPGPETTALVAQIERMRPGATALLRAPEELRARSQVFRTGAVDRFRVELPGTEARRRLAGYWSTLSAEDRKTLGEQKTWSGKTVREILAGAPEIDRVSFPALALDRRGRPIPVQSSDEVFDLFYGEPSRSELLASVQRTFQPFPIGLATPVGLVAANPAYSNRSGDAEVFGRDRYHGAVIWSWPQTMMRRGLEKQLARFHDDAEVATTLSRALKQMDGMDANVGALKASELWSWRASAGRIEAVPFDSATDRNTESNALQLWSNTSSAAK